MVDSFYYSSRKIPERCENSSVDYRINYQKLCYLLRQITKDLNSVTVCIGCFKFHISPTQCLLISSIIMVLLLLFVDSCHRN